MSTYVYVSYPRKEGMWFDVCLPLDLLSQVSSTSSIHSMLTPLQMDYYLKTHMSIVDKHWGPYGMKSWSVVQFEEGDPSGMHCQAIMLWSSQEDFQKAFDANIPEVMTDLQHYSDVVPVRWFGRVLKQG